MSTHNSERQGGCQKESGHEKNAFIQIILGCAFDRASKSPFQVLAQCLGLVLPVPSLPAREGRCDVLLPTSSSTSSASCGYLETGSEETAFNEVCSPSSIDRWGPGAWSGLLKVWFPISVDSCQAA
jgi:hypothetical protein